MPAISPIHTRTSIAPTLPVSPPPKRESSNTTSEVASSSGSLSPSPIQAMEAVSFAEPGYPIVVTTKIAGVACAVCSQIAKVWMLGDGRRTGYESKVVYSLKLGNPALPPYKLD